MWRRLLVFLFILFGFLGSLHGYALADTSPDTFVKGKVLQIHLGTNTPGIQKSANFDVQLLESSLKDKTVSVSYTDNPGLAVTDVRQGNIIIVDIRPDPTTGKSSYFLYEIYRLDFLWYLVGAFILLVLGVAGKKGLGALIGLAVSLAVISFYMIPQIINQQDPFTVCITGAAIILLVTTYVAHGISLRTTLAILSTGIVLLLAGGLSQGIAGLLHLSGLGNQDIYDLEIGASHPISPQGLFLGGIFIGTLGALNDITTTQVITIFTLIKENPAQTFGGLMKKGMEIGKEHIASLINTLVLAYAGTSLVVFIFFALNPQNLPWWVILNNESTIEEIVRSIVGSIALILVVPVSTFLAVWVGLKGTSIKELVTSPGS